MKSPRNLSFGEGNGRAKNVIIIIIIFLLLPGKKNIYSTNSTAVVVCRCTHYCHYIGIGVNTSILHITAATDLEETKNGILRLCMKIVVCLFQHETLV